MCHKLGQILDRGQQIITDKAAVSLASIWVPSLLCGDGTVICTVMSDDQTALACRQLARHFLFERTGISTMQAISASDNFNHALPVWPIEQAVRCCSNLCKYSTSEFGIFIA